MPLLRDELATLYELDGRGRMVRERRSSTASFFAPPLVSVVAGADGLVWACGSGLPDATAVEVDALLRREPAPVGHDVPDVGWVPACADAVVGRLGLPATIGTGPSFVAPVDVSTSPAPSEVELRTSVDTDLVDVAPLLPERDAILDPPWALAMVEGAVAAVCETARSTPTSVEAGVWTYERFRRRGFATAVTRRWLDLVGERTAFYSTSADNAASQGVARRLGLTPIGQWWQVRPAEG